MWAHSLEAQYIPVRLWPLPLKKRLRLLCSFITTLLATRNPAGFVNTAEIRAMHRSGLVAFASHSNSHVYFNGLSPATMHAELEKSLAFIRRMVSA